MKQVRAGTVLAPNSDCKHAFSTDWNIEQRGEAVVESTKVKVKVGRGNGAVKYTADSGYHVIYNGIPMFRFHCRK